MKDIYFQLFVPFAGRCLQEQLECLEQELFLWMERMSLEEQQLLRVKIYLTDAANQSDAVFSSPLYISFLASAAVSLIEQPLLSGTKIALLVWATPYEVVKKGTPDCMELSFNHLTFLFHSVRFVGEEGRIMDAEQQTKAAFRQHISELAARGMSLEEHCHRTWIYVRDIDRNYAGVVTGRNQIFDEQGLTSETHYIASTGIGGRSADRNAIVAIDFMSVAGLNREDVKYLAALDYLNPTHEYGVAFERGAQLTLPHGRLSFISGTASIDKNGDCVHRGDVLTQTGRLFLNMEKLLADGGATLGDIQYMIVYLRDIADYGAVESYLHLRFPHTPFLITEARVCRPEWLIEVESVALTDC